MGPLMHRLREQQLAAADRLSEAVDMWIRTDDDAPDIAEIEGRLVHAFRAYGIARRPRVIPAALNPRLMESGLRLAARIARENA